MSRLVGSSVGSRHGAAIDTSTIAGKLVFGIFAAFVEFERELSSESTIASLVLARVNGHHGARLFKVTATKLRLAMVSNGKLDTKVGVLCKKFGVTRQTRYRHVSPNGELQPDAAKLLAKQSLRQWNEFLTICAIIF